MEHDSINADDRELEFIEVGIKIRPEWSSGCNASADKNLITTAKISEKIDIGNVESVRLENHHSKVLDLANRTGCRRRQGVVNLRLGRGCGHHRGNDG